MQLARHSLLLLLYTLSSFAQGAVYKSVDEQGNVTYTDTQPGKQSEEVELKPITPVKFDPPKPVKIQSAPPTQKKKKSEKVYSVLAITSPANDATVHNAGNFSVQVALSPELDSEHRIQLLLDGELIAPPQKTLSFQLSNIDRGTHTLRVEIISLEKKVVQSTSSTIHVHRPCVRPNGTVGCFPEITSPEANR